MIITANLFITKIEDGSIEGIDISDKKQYIGHFFTDADINKMPKKEKPKGFKSEKISQDMLLKMLETSNNFNERDTKVSDKIEKEIENSVILKSLSKYIQRCKDDEEEILAEEVSVKIKESEVSEFLGFEKITHKNFKEALSLMEEKNKEAIDSITLKVNESYNISVNTPIVFTGNLTKDNEIHSKNAYVDANGELTSRVNFYSSGIRGNYFEDPLMMALSINKKTYNEKTWFEYNIDSFFLTPEKVFHLIKRSKNTILKSEQDLLISFQLKNKNSKENDSIVELNTILNNYREESKEVKDKKSIFKKYSKDIINTLDKINDSIQEDFKTFQENYDIKLPIKNNFELEQNIKDYINKEMNVFKNINKKLLEELVDLREKTSDKKREEIATNLERYTLSLYEKGFEKIDKFSTYFRIAGFKDNDNDGYGFITDVPGSSRKVKNFIGFSVNIKQFSEVKEEVFEELNRIKEDIKAKLK